MPNRYIYQKMSADEFRAAAKAAGLTKSDLCKLLGRHYYDICNYMDGKKQPTNLESVIMDYVAEYPEHAPVLLDMAEVRIVGQGKESKHVESV